MASLFVLSTIENIGPVCVAKVRGKWGIGDVVAAPFKQSQDEAAIVAAISELSYGIRNYLWSKDDGTVPETDIPRDFLDVVINLENEAPRNSKYDYYQFLGSRLKRLFENQRYVRCMDQLEEKCQRIGNMLGTAPGEERLFRGTPLPEYTYTMPNQPGTLNIYGRLRLGMMENASLLYAPPQKGIMFTGSDYGNIFPPPYDNYWNFFPTIMPLINLLSIVNPETLLRIRGDLAMVERGTLLLYRFMNATRAACATELLLNNI